MNAFYGDDNLQGMSMGLVLRETFPLIPMDFFLVCQTSGLFRSIHHQLSLPSRPAFLKATVENSRASRIIGARPGGADDLLKQFLSRGKAP